MDKKVYLCNRVVRCSKAQHTSEFALSLNRYHKIETLLFYSDTQLDTVFLTIHRKDTHILLKSLYLVFGRHYRYSVSINKNNSYSIHTSLYLRSFAIFAWSLARLRLEKADKVLRIFKAEALADLRNAEGFIHK